MWQQELKLRPFPRGYHLITREIEEVLPSLPETGLLHIFIRHTSAGLNINENADPGVRKDMETIMNKLVPEGDPDYTHTAEGPDDMPSHVKALMAGSSITIPITNGQLALGTWQGVYLCEFRNHGGPRRLVLTIFA